MSLTAHHPRLKRMRGTSKAVVFLQDG